MELPESIQRAIDRYQPVEAEGVTLYPIRVKEYRGFAMGRAVIACLQQAMPPDLMNVPLLDAFFRLDMRNLAAGRPGAGWMARCLLFLALALDIGPEGDDRGRVSQFDIMVDPKRPERLKAIYFTQGGQQKRITPVQFSRLRPILAAQNGIPLESDYANPELVEAEKDLLDGSGIQLEGGIEAVITGVAALSRAEEGQIAEWPILKLERRKSSWERILRYLVCGVGEAAGGRWKYGNPQPSPWLDRKQTLSPALRPLDSYAGGEGRKAMNDAGYPA